MKGDVVHVCYGVAEHDQGTVARELRKSSSCMCHVSLSLL